MPMPGAVTPSPRTAVVWEALTGLLDERAAAGAAAISVLDLGGGTGGFAVPLASLGHEVTVVDESADALATLARRAAEHGVTVRGVQGDASDLGASVSAAVDLVLCHNVLEYVDDPAATLAEVAAVLRPGAAVSVLAPNRLAAVVHRALAGRFAEAKHALGDRLGTWGAGDPMPRRFTLADLTVLLTGAGLEVTAVHGVRVFADLVPGGVADGEPGGQAALLALEKVAAEHPELRALATSLHVVAMRRDD
ncbi:MAG: methyltransferase domain-containing protein [Streptosporangiales bacterium]|nr:methyltransferase domain-containing protein [Streptosporangiales bacterium]